MYCNFCISKMTPKETLGLSCNNQIAQLMNHMSTYAYVYICIHSCCLPCSYIAESFRILQRVIRSQR